MYQIPPRTSAEGYKAAEWNVENFIWKGRLRVLEIGTRCELRLEVRHLTIFSLPPGRPLLPRWRWGCPRRHEVPPCLETRRLSLPLSSGPHCCLSHRPQLTRQDGSTGELFAQVNYAKPFSQVEPVLDSSRYFVLRVEGEGGKVAYIGMGFQERGDAFDFQVRPLPLRVYDQICLRGEYDLPPTRCSCLGCPGPED